MWPRQAVPCCDYLIGKFASDAGKKAGEFYTLPEVSTLLALLIKCAKQAGSENYASISPMIEATYRDLINRDISQENAGVKSPQTSHKLFLLVTNRGGQGA